MAATDFSYATFPARRLTDALKAAGPPLLFGLRLWASVSLALYVAFWLELDNPVWAGTSAAIVCQPHLGASLRKGWYRMIGTLVGAVAIVVLTACFPQDRVLFLRTCQEINESTFERIEYGFTTVSSYHML